MSLGFHANTSITAFSRITIDTSAFIWQHGHWVLIGTYICDQYSIYDEQKVLVQHTNIKTRIKMSVFWWCAKWMIKGSTRSFWLNSAYSWSNFEYRLGFNNKNRKYIAINKPVMNLDWSVIGTSVPFAFQTQFLWVALTLSELETLSLRAIQNLESNPLITSRWKGHQNIYVKILEM